MTCIYYSQWHNIYFCERDGVENAQDCPCKGIENKCPFIKSGNENKRVRIIDPYWVDIINKCNERFA